jgi:predicted regulator of Ras-like GTPase activity (Roadblock/LC7/MglB family)
MPYQALLERMLAAVPGVHAALMLDSEGELVVEAGRREERLRLIGAYQGIALATAQRTARRLAGGPLTYMHARYAWGQIVVRPLKDGYYMVLSLDADTPVGPSLHHAALAQASLDAEL